MIGTSVMKELKLIKLLLIKKDQRRIQKESRQTYKSEVFANIFHGLQPVAIFSEIAVKRR